MLRIAENIILIKHSVKVAWVARMVQKIMITLVFIPKQQLLKDIQHSVTIRENTLQGMHYEFGSAGAGASLRALGLKTAGAHSTRSLKISGCKR